MNSPTRSSKPAEIGLIWAQARNGVIGNAGAMPWHLPEDLAHFKRVTLNHPVIMGRRTWESIPPRFRPLPGRTNIVITRQPDWAEAGARRAANFEQAIEMAAGAERIWVIGGAQIFRQALPLADALVITRIDADFAGDVHAPPIGPEWRRLESEACLAAGGTRLCFETWRRADGAGNE